jgi:hypothetical protein
MPIPKGPNCFGDVMKEHKAGQLHSGKGGPVVKSDKQAKAIASSMCYDEGCGGGCGCKSCPRAQGRKAAVMTMGYSEEAADALVFGQMAAPLGYPTPNFGPEVNEAIMNAKEGKPGLWANIHAKRKRMKRKGNKERKARKGDKNYPDTLDIDKKDKADHATQGIPGIKYGTYDEAKHGESSDTEMALARVDVMLGRLSEMKQGLMQMQSMGADIEIDAWMRDKLTLSADYISAVADNALFGGGLEAEYDEGKRPDYPDVDKDGNRKESMESAIKNAKAKKAKAKKAGIKIS